MNGSDYWKLIYKEGGNVPIVISSYCGLQPAWELQKASKSGNGSDQTQLLKYSSKTKRKRILEISTLRMHRSDCMSSYNVFLLNVHEMYPRSSVISRLLVWCFVGSWLYMMSGVMWWYM